MSCMKIKILNGLLGKVDNIIQRFIDLLDDTLVNLATSSALQKSKLKRIWEKSSYTFVNYSLS